MFNVSLVQLSMQSMRFLLCSHFGLWTQLEVEQLVLDGQNVFFTGNAGTGKPVTFCASPDLCLDIALLSLPKQAGRVAAKVCAAAAPLQLLLLISNSAWCSSSSSCSVTGWPAP